MGIFVSKGNEWTGRVLVLFSTLLMVSVPGSEAYAGLDDIPAILERHGFPSLDPPVDAPDFTLEDLSGRKRTLSDHHGRWIILTFWAPWCGPCVSELPGMFALARTLKGKGVDLVAVALSDSAGEVKRVLPAPASSLTDVDVLLDKEGEAASLYKAFSVPTTFVLDPVGRIVTVARGARNWAAEKDLFEDLSAALPPSEQAARRYLAEPGKPIELPAGVEPPRAEARLEPAEVTVGEPVVLVVDVKWTGRIQDYVLHPPKLEPPEGIEVSAVRAESDSRGGRQSLTYKIELRARKQGKYSLDPIEVSYTPALDGKRVTTRVKGPTLVVSVKRILGLPVKWFVAACLSLLVLSCVSVAVWVKKRPVKDMDSTEPATVHLLKNGVKRAKAALVSGDTEEFLECIIKLDDKVPGSVGVSRQDLERMYQDVKYGGIKPPRNELTRMLRGLELKLGELTRDDPEDTR